MTISFIFMLLTFFTALNKLHRAGDFITTKAPTGKILYNTIDNTPYTEMKEVKVYYSDKVIAESDAMRPIYCLLLIIFGGMTLIFLFIGTFIYINKYDISRYLCRKLK
jgi:hypothetical protein